LKELAKQGLRKIGLEAHRFFLRSSPPAQLVASLHKFSIDLVLDVGANKGQFEPELRQCAYTGRIISLEPLSQIRDELM
jgi:hypothetical protein